MNLTENLEINLTKHGNLDYDKASQISGEIPDF